MESKSGRQLVQNLERAIGRHVTLALPLVYLQTLGGRGFSQILRSTAAPGGSGVSRLGVWLDTRPRLLQT